MILDKSHARYHPSLNLSSKLKYLNKIHLKKHLTRNQEKNRVLLKKKKPNKETKRNKTLSYQWKRYKWTSKNRITLFFRNEDLMFQKITKITIFILLPDKTSQQLWQHCCMLSLIPHATLLKMENGRHLSTIELFNLYYFYLHCSLVTSTKKEWSICRN